MKFNSQICTTKEQSERLLALGLKKVTADCIWCEVRTLSKDNSIQWRLLPEYIDKYDEKHIPAWSLGRLIEMLPSPIYPKEELPSFSGCAYLNLAQIAVWYDYTDYDMDDRTLISWSGNGFFSAVVNCIEWLIKEGYFNKEYLEE